MRLLGWIVVALLLLWLFVNFTKGPSEFINIFVIGISNGAVYGLITYAPYRAS